MKLNKYTFPIISFMLFIILFSIVLFRAFHLNITYDEVWTFDFATQSIKDIMTAEANFSSANNHILNSILIKPFLSLFGHHVWVLRLPNVLSYILYFGAGFYVSKQLSSKPMVQIMAVILLNTNIYLLDFFSLSRGYGLANAFEISSIALMFVYYKNEKQIFIWFSFLLSCLAVLSNFTWLNFYVSMWAVFVVIEIYKHGFQFKNLLIKNISPIFFAIITFMFSYIPISILRKQDEFKWGANAWIDSLHTFAKDINYHSSFTWAVMTQIIIIAIFIIAVYILYKNKHQIQQNLLFFTLLIFTIVSATIIQRFLLNTMYMDGRKATMYISLLMCLMVCLVDYFHTKYATISIVLIALFTGHFIYFFNLFSVREWWFDKHNLEVMKYIDTHPIDGQKSITTTWYFGSSMNYYNRFQFNNRLQNMSSFKDQFVNLSPAYFYVFDEDINKIPTNYQLVKKYSIGSKLYQKK